MQTPSNVGSDIDRSSTLNPALVPISQHHIALFHEYYSRSAQARAIAAMAMASLIDMHRLLLPVHKGESPPTDRNMRFVTLLFGVIMLIEYTILVRQLRTLATNSKVGNFWFRTLLRGMGLLFFMYVPRYLARFIRTQHGF